MKEPEILYQDDDVWVVHKPAGWVVNSAETTTSPTIQWWWQNQRPTLWVNDWSTQVPADFDTGYGSPEAIFADRAGIVHRLDKETSGVLVLACHPGSLVNLLAQFKKRTTLKKYLALVHGKFQVPEAVIDAPVGRAHRDRKVFAVRVDGRTAQTKYSVLQTYQGVDAVRLFAEVPEGERGSLTSFIKRFSIYQGFSLVQCEPLTGRTHQIRVHMAHIHHPLVGDVTYLGRNRAKLDPIWCPRHFLHAAEIQVRHPRTGATLSVKAELPGDLAHALQSLTLAD